MRRKRCLCATPAGFLPRLGGFHHQCVKTSQARARRYFLRGFAIGDEFLNGAALAQRDEMDGAGTWAWRAKHPPRPRLLR
jgi:hypothetical protein